MALSERQNQMLQFIRDYTREHGYPPTIREIGRGCGISSTSVVNYNLNILEQERHLQRGKVTARGLKLANDLRETLRIPLLGAIAAGQPLLIPDSDFSPTGNDYIELTRDIVREQEGLYALKVQGDSMMDALVYDGDIVVMRHQKEANNGDMVAVWLKDEKATTLKRFYRENGKVRLQPANPTMQPMYYHPSQVEIQGKVMVVIRRLN